MSNSEMSAGQRRGVDPLDFSNRDDGRAELKSMLDTIAAQLVDADRRHTAALTEMQARIDGMGREADEIRPRVPHEFAPAFAQIETAMAELAQRLAGAGDSTAPSPQPSVQEARSGDAGRASTPMPLRSGANRRAADRRQRDEGISSRTPAVDTFDVIGSIPGDTSNPWDRESAEALASVYESGAANFSPRTMPGAPSSVDQAWLESRFAEIASGIEQSLAATRSDRGLSEITQRLDQFERQFAKLFAGVATHDDLAAVRLIEAHVGEVVNHLVQTQDQLERLNIIEAQLATISHTLADVQAASPKGKEDDAQAKPSVDVDAIARAAAQETAQRFADLRNEDRHSAADELRPLIERLMSENRQGEEQTAALLDTMQQAMIRLLDRVDSIEISQQQAPATTPEPVVYRSSMFASETAGHADLLDEDQANVLDAAVAAISASAMAAPVAQPRPSEDTVAPEEAVRKSEKIRQDFVAEARRAKMRLAAEQDDIVIGPSSLTSRSSSATEDASAGSLLGSRPIRPAAAQPKKTSGPSAPSPRLMIIAAVALLALGSLWYTLGFGGNHQTAVEPAAVQPAAPAPSPQANGAAVSGSSDAVKSAPAEPSPSGNADKTDSSPSATGPRSDLAPSGDTQSQNAQADGTVHRTTALPMLGVAVDLDQPMTEAQLQQAKRHQAMASMSGELGAAAARSGDAAAVPTSMVPSEAETEGANPQDTTGSLPETKKTTPLDMPAATVGPLSLRLAAANGDSSAEFEVGARLAEGKGTTQSFKDAAKWYQRSADQGFAQAQYRLGTLYERGLGLKPDRAQAAAWYQKAAEQGNMKAMHNLAVLAANQSDQSPDYTTAAQWFEQAAQRGLPDSQFNLAVLYENGLGVKRDMSRAFMWLSIAARNGDADAVRRRDILRGKLTAEEIAAADKMIAAWKPMPSDRSINDARTAGEIWKNNPKNGISG